MYMHSAWEGLVQRSCPPLPSRYVGSLDCAYSNLLAKPHSRALAVDKLETGYIRLLANKCLGVSNWGLYKNSEHSLNPNVW